MQNELRQQLVAKIGTEGGFGATFAAADVIGLIYELTCQPEQAMHQRRPFRVSTGGVRQVPGSQIWNIGFKMAAIGSGSPGSAPKWGLPIRACGFGQTVNSGSASVGTPRSDSRNHMPIATPNITGAFTGTKSGVLEITAINSNIDVALIFRPTDGTAMVYGTAENVEGGSPVSITSVVAGLSIELPIDPGQVIVGDRWTVALTSDQDTSVVYKKIYTAIPCLDLGVYQDGTYHYFHSARGNALYAGEIDGIGMWEFQMKGVLESHGDSAIFSTGAVFDDVIPPGWKNLAVSGVIPSSAPFTSFSLDCGNVVTARKDARSTSPRGVYSCNIVEHNIIGKINPELVTDATFDALDALMDGSVSAMTLQQGSEDGNIILFSADRVQITNLQHGARERILTRDLDLAFTEPEYAADDDYNELSITVK